MNEKGNDDYKQNLLFRINDNLIRLDEKLKALTEANSKVHEQIIEDIKEILKEHRDLVERVGKLELEGVKLGIFWKILVITLPILAGFGINGLFKLLGIV